VSIGLTVGNGGMVLESATDALLAQPYGDFELVVVDNASTDGTEAAGPMKRRAVASSHPAG